MLTPETTGVPVVEPLCKVAKVAELLDVSPDWVYERIRSGEFATVVELGEGRAISASPRPRFSGS